MATDFLWYVVPQDGPYPWEPEGARSIDLDYLKLLGGVVERSGFSGALFATAAHDVWVLGTALATRAKKLRPLLAVHPGLISPTLLAKMALTFDTLFDGRLIFNVINGDTPTLRTYGLHVEHDERYELAGEYWDIVKRLTAGETVTFKGKHFDIENASVNGLKPVQFPHVPLWFGGSSEAGMQLAAKHIDVYLSWGEPPEQLREKITRLRALAEQQGRQIRFGLRVHTIVRDTDAEAWAWADNLLRVTRRETVDRIVAASKANDSVGIQRQYASHGGLLPDSAKDLEVYPNVWPGMSLLRHGPGTALVGSHASVIERLQEFESLGIDTFILSGNPLLEEALHVSETILPALGVKSGTTT
ncbi:LLM class flavin-dependent oxidoreductase [Motilibacter deserti]|uniref:LLM class flavin-dependent oxidoreductase n=1 Tax=Motilibacter deserti TaxID=2714956 RepID=A0ABX0H328_9ACTN|nr:LLM class flavin-dependent oxidoreductase [Motilibacter deserti]NHC16276.1 LLM class flavin-dependent oxidoreductase [Motilibacter deserti]